MEDIVELFIFNKFPDIVVVVVLVVVVSVVFVVHIACDLKSVLTECNFSCILFVCVCVSTTWDTKCS